MAIATPISLGLVMGIVSKNPPNFASQLLAVAIYGWWLQIPSKFGPNTSESRQRNPPLTLIPPVPKKGRVIFKFRRVSEHQHWGDIGILFRFP